MRSGAAFITCMLRFASVKTAFAFAFASPRAVPASRRGRTTHRFISSSSSSSSSMTTVAAVVPPVALEDHSPSYKLLLEKLRTVAHLNNAASVLNYDRQVFMPSKSDKASAARGRQLAALATISHEMSTDPAIGKLIEDATRDLDELMSKSSPSCEEGGDDRGGGSLGTARRILELEGEAYKKRVCIPAELAARKAELEAAANHAWVKVSVQLILLFVTSCGRPHGLCTSHECTYVIFSAPPSYRRTATVQRTGASK